MTVPEHLARDTKKWWRSVTESYELEPHHVRLLTLACESWDRAQQAREALNGDLTFVDRFGQPRARPEVAIERDNRLAFARLLRELDLDVSAPASAARPPQLRRFENAS